MKKFVFYIVSEKFDGKLSQRIRTMNVFQIKKNSLIACGDITVNTGGYKGNETEIMHHLYRKEFLPKTFSEGYYKRDNGKFTIEQI